jgi:hypothetical protein
MHILENNIPGKNHALQNIDKKRKFNHKHAAWQGLTRYVILKETIFRCTWLIN